MVTYCSMNLSRPLRTLFPSVEAAALESLLSNPGARSGREVARLADVSHPAASRALNWLVGQGVVEREQAGRAFMYRLNDQHLAVTSIRDLASLRVRLVEAIREDFAGWEVQTLHASLFGSVARDGGDQQSDVDLLVVRPSNTPVDDAQWREQLDGLSQQILAWTGNHAGMAEIDLLDLKRLETRPSTGVLSEVMRDGIQVGGISLKSLLREHAG